MEEKSTHECKNCSTEIDGKYCHFCGQQYHDHKESFGELVYEFVSDFLHFDSRFFRTVLPLIFQPGKLTKNYNEGKQRSQFHPIRLYLFSSFIYFFLFFYFNNVDEVFENEGISNHPVVFIADSKKHVKAEDSLKLANQYISDTFVKNKIPDNLTSVISDSDKKEFATLNDSNEKYAITVTPYIDSLLQKKITPEQYLMLQKSPGNTHKAGYFERIITVRLLKINLKGEEGKKDFFKKLFETFLHNIPKMLFFLLPIFALFLKLLYIRRKQFYYVDHAVLSLHYFSLVFLLLILSNYILGRIFSTGTFTFLAFLWMTIYLLMAMKRIYMQSWRKTMLKFFALGFLLTFAIIFTILANMAWSAFMI